MMHTLDPKTSDSRRSPYPWLIVGACLLVVLLGVLLPRPHTPAESGPAATSAPPASASGPRSRSSLRKLPRSGSAGAEVSAEQEVAARMARFARSRLAITQAMARKLKVAIPPELERFFALAESGKWDELKAAYDALRAQRQTEAGNDLQPLWGPVLETYGVAEMAHNWPAQQLLDYGQAILDSLRPGMVYVGGTDAGRFIPTLLNDTGEGEHHVILTQNALADNTYLQYLGFLYGDQMPVLNEEDSQRAFSDYLADAQKRLAHDQQFPDEPKQLRPGEGVRIQDNRVMVSGQVAVMGINERLLQMFLDKNPGASVALEESFPFPSMQANAVPLGPVLELRAQDAAAAAASDRGAQAIDYWRSAAQQLGSDPGAAPDPNVNMAYAKMAAAQAGLLASQNSSADAEQLYLVATQICPTSPDAVSGCVNLLLGENKPDQARAVLERALTAAPGNSQFRSLLDTINQGSARH